MVVKVFVRDEVSGGSVFTCKGACSLATDMWLTRECMSYDVVSMCIHILHRDCLLPLQVLRYKKHCVGGSVSDPSATDY